MSVVLFQMPGTNPYENLALEEYILETKPQGDYLLLWKNHNTIVVGRHQNTLEEVNQSFVKEHAIRVVRRITGGGAVYHDMGNHNFSFITTVKNPATVTFAHFTKPVIQALAALGVQAETSGRNDIVVDGRKISGNAQSLRGKRMLHHGTLLFEADLGFVAQALKVHPAKLQSKGVQSVRSRVANIKEFLPAHVTLEDFQQQIVKAFASHSQCAHLELTEADWAAIRTLATEKYASWDWNYGKSPEATLVHMQKYPGGIVDVRLTVRNGIIAACTFYGDYMALRPSVEIAEALTGCRYDAEIVAQCLAPFPLSEYFGSITLEEILGCLFPQEAEPA